MLLEGQRLGWSASGRNGGFCDFSLTHGEGNGEKHLPEENELLTRMGLQNLDEIQEAVERYGLDCEFERTGKMNVATDDYQIPELAAGHDPDADAYFMNAAELAEHIVSPTFKAGRWTKRSTAMLHPAKLVWQLARVVRELGVEVHGHTPVRLVEPLGRSPVLG